MTLLSILIPTLTRRKETFIKLKTEIEKQSLPFKDNIEIIELEDEGELTIGRKRNLLYEMAKGKYSVQWDDDDWIHENTIELIMNALDLNVDCITFDEYDLVNSKFYKTNYSLKNEYEVYDKNGYGILKAPYPKCVIKTELARKIKFNENIKYAEDYHWSVQMKHILKSEYHIDEFIYIYSNLANENANVKIRYSDNKNKII